jgi:hypothetical protein
MEKFKYDSVFFTNIVCSFCFIVCIYAYMYIEKIQERALRFIYDDFLNSYEFLLEK